MALMSVTAQTGVLHPPTAHCYKIFSQKSLRSLTKAQTNFFRVSNQTAALNTGPSVRCVLFGQCVCSFQELCVHVCPVLSCHMAAVLAHSVNTAGCLPWLHG